MQNVLQKQILFHSAPSLLFFLWWQNKWKEWFVLGSKRFTWIRIKLLCSIANQPMTTNEGLLNRILTSFNAFYRALPSFTWFYLALPSFTQFYLVLPSFTEFYLVFFPSFTSFYLVLPIFTEFYRCLPSLIWTSLLCSTANQRSRWRPPRDCWTRPARTTASSTVPSR